MGQGGGACIWAGQRSGQRPQRLGLRTFWKDLIGVDSPNSGRRCVAVRVWRKRVSVKQCKETPLDHHLCQDGRRQDGQLTGYHQLATPLCQAGVYLAARLGVLTYESL